jgi:hypothetical protein
MRPRRASRRLGGSPRRAGRVGVALVGGSFDISTTDKITAPPMANNAEVPLGSL